MSQHRAVRQGPPDGRLRTPDPEGRAAARRAHKGVARSNAYTGRREPVVGGGPLTAAGVAVVLSGACLIGGLIDLLLVGTAAWAITGLFLAASAYAAAKVHRQGWYSAVVGPPLAFALGLGLIASFSPHDLGSGPVGVAATILELLAVKARTVFLGTGIAVLTVLVRKLPFKR